MPTSTSETNKVIVTTKRKAVKELKAKHFNKTQIQKKLAVSPQFVRKWWNADNLEVDRRGWPKGKLRVYTKEDTKGILFLRDRLINQKAIFYGPEAILGQHKQEFPKLRLPSYSFVARTLRKHGVVKRYRQRVKGGSVYQHYPAESILSLGKVVQEADFTGRKTLKGHKRPLHFWARVYLKPFKLPRITRIASPSGQQAAEALIKDWKNYPLPNILKLDNDTAFYPAGRYADRWISRFICWLLNLGISPVFSAFSKPWNNGSVEGLNSVFTKKIWLQRYHKTLTELDRSIDKLNQEYAAKVAAKLKAGLPLNYSANPKEAKLEPNLFNPTIYFTRQVKSIDEQTCIRVLKVPVHLPESYLKQFVLAKLNVYKEQLTIYHETKPGNLQKLKELKFPIKHH